MDSVFTLAFALKAIISLGEYFNDLKTHVPWLLFILYFIPEATSWPCPFFLYIYISPFPHHVIQPWAASNHGNQLGLVSHCRLQRTSFPPSPPLFTLHLFFCFNYSNCSMKCASPSLTIQKVVAILLRFTQQQLEFSLICPSLSLPFEKERTLQ